MTPAEWRRYGRGQVHCGNERGYLYRNILNTRMWMWKGIQFEADTLEKAIDMLLGQKVKKAV
jgi:hypothetical protein